MPCAARPLRGSRALAAVHPLIAVGVATAVGVFAVVLLLPMLGMTRVSAGGTRSMLGMVRPTVLGMLMVARLRLGRLCGSGRGEAECRSSGKKDGLHVSIS